MLSFHLVVLGPQGSGKGTQTDLLSKYFKMPSLVAGDLIRAKAQDKSELGKKVKDIIDKGGLIPCDITKNLFEDALKTISQNQTIIFDGYPRTMVQVTDFEDILSEREIKDKKIVVLEISQKVTLERLASRRVCVGCGANYKPPESLTLKQCQKCGGKLVKRHDDYEKAIKNRLNVYEKETRPVIEYYERQEKAVRINGEQSVEEVNKEIIRKIQE